ncbi:hypothetical protein J2W22_003061 [Sphingomonas kyeonggiensis]|uniref:hypothetical protein n=1 Tax=Sphingomonas kyeonggiensis TaxID=1268553 RepID=UPI002784C871|nr:hypothetical protein [Sphingomonas kyeonggiensis]MDQ0250997.1 hypothetical protein [Sphingomonas kyeonggiensis]
MKSLVATSLIALFSVSASSTAVGRGTCMAGMGQALAAGHFSGPIICAPQDATFTLVGKTARDGYAIYDYRYRYRPPQAAVDHGGQRILVFRGGEYLGQYAASPPHPVSLSVHGSVLRIAEKPGDGNLPLDFSHGPPRKALISGMEAEFFR